MKIQNFTTISNAFVLHGQYEEAIDGDDDGVNGTDVDGDEANESDGDEDSVNNAELGAMNDTLNVVNEHELVKQIYSYFFTLIQKYQAMNSNDDFRNNKFPMKFS